MQSTRGRLSIAATALACAPFLGACADARPPTAVDPPRAELDFTNGPPTAGPFVARFADRLVFFFAADERRNLLSLHFPLDVDFCGGGATRNMADIQFVTTPSEVGQVLALIQDDDGAVAIYGTSDLVEAFGAGGPFSDIPHLCAFMNGPKKIAEGTARRVSVFSTNSFSGNWTGTLTDALGDPVQYAEHHVFVVNPRTGEQTFPTASILLSP